MKSTASPKASEAGFTLIETVIGITIIAMLAAVTYQLEAFGIRQIQRYFGNARIHADARQTIVWLSEDGFEATGVEVGQGAAVIFRYGGNQIWYVLDAENTRLLRQVRDGSGQTILKEHPLGLAVTNFAVSIDQANRLLMYEWTADHSLSTPLTIHGGIYLQSAA